MLAHWRTVTEREYPEFVDMIPRPEDIDLDKLVGGGIMTDTCNAARSMNEKLSAEVNGVTHNLLCWNHILNVHVKNVLDSLTEFLRTLFSDRLDEIAPEFRVSPGFITFARAFDKMFSLCDLCQLPQGMG